LTTENSIAVVKLESSDPKFVPVKITQVSPPIKLTLAKWQLKKKKENM